MRIAIVDDSRLARLELKQQLAHLAEVEVVAEAASVAEALAMLSDAAIDLLLLDIDLPDGNGFDVLEQAATVPLVIFVTAFNEYAIRSFEVNALDYLLKPVRQERLLQAIDKARRLAQSPTVKAEQRIFIKDRDQCYFVQVADIIAFEALGNYTRVHLAGATPAIYRTIGSVAERLDPNVFFRASRSWIINTQFIEHIEPSISGGFHVELKNGQHVDISKRQAAAFRQAWSL